MTDKITESGLFATLSQKDKVLTLIYDYPGSNKNDLIKSCIHVSSVSSVSGYKRYKGDKDTTLHNGIKTELKRQTDKKTIIVNKSVMPFTRLFDCL